MYDPVGQRIELACYKFEPPPGIPHSQVLLEAHRLRIAEGAYNIEESHLTDAIELLVQRTMRTLSADREAKQPYVHPVDDP